MKRILITTLALGLAASLNVAAATRNWLAQPELYCSPVPRPRNGKAAKDDYWGFGPLRHKRPARKHRRAQHAGRH